MKTQNYSAAITVNTTANEAFKAINNVPGWWSENTEGSSENLNDIFTVHFGEPFVTFKIIEVVQDQKVVWLVTDCYLPWLNDKTEWNGTKVSYEISANNNSTQIDFTHIGLVPGIECYDSCVKGWDQYFKGSLFELITAGKGVPQRRQQHVA